ncbi:MAG: sulfotransferase [Chitinivibrionales bacterium]|nr:sulfotransferase [Chitinivibrionales bacterium]
MPRRFFNYFVAMLKTKKVCLPNFLLVGAAKAGSTAVATYLEQHPQIYMSPMKEPKFISSHFIKRPYNGPGDDFVENFTIRNLPTYQGLFRWVRRHLAIGEASVENLFYYQKAIPVIKKLLGNPKIIILLRNPVDRAFSAYKMMVRDYREKLSFEEALEREKERKEKNWEYLWFYREVGLYYEQVKAYCEAFTDVKIALYDDFHDDTIAFMQNLYRFLGVRDNFKPEVSLKFNASGRFRNIFLQLLYRASGFKGLLYKFLSLNGISDSTILSTIDSVREGDLEPIHLDPETKHKLTKYFSNDVKKLEKLIGRDLKEWLA